MKMAFGLGISVVVGIALTCGEVQGSSIHAARHAAYSNEIAELFVAWNSHDPDKVAASFTEDAVYEDVAEGHISRGRSEVRNWAKGAFAVVGDFKYKVVSSSSHNGHGVAEWILIGTDKGLFKTGKKFTVRGASVFEVRGGKISRYTEFYDVATIMRQVGVLPTPKE